METRTLTMGDVVDVLLLVVEDCVSLSESPRHDVCRLDVERGEELVLEEEDAVLGQISAV